MGSLGTSIMKLSHPENVTALQDRLVGALHLLANHAEVNAVLQRLHPDFKIGGPLSLHFHGCELDWLMSCLCYG